MADTPLYPRSDHKTPADRAIEAGTFVRHTVYQNGFAVGWIDELVDPEQVHWGARPPDPPVPTTPDGDDRG